MECQQAIGIDRTDLENWGLLPFVRKELEHVKRQGKDIKAAGFDLACKVKRETSQCNDEDWNKETARAALNLFYDLALEDKNEWAPLEGKESVTCSARDIQVAIERAWGGEQVSLPTTDVKEKIEISIDEGSSQPDTKGEPENSDSLVFPYHVISGLAGDFAGIYSSYIEAPREALYFAYLTFLGNEICDLVRLDTELNAPPRLYTVIIGETAETRKSTAIEKARELFLCCNPDTNVCNGVGSAEGLARAVNAVRGSRRNNQNNIILYLDEITHLTQKMKGENSTLLPCANSLFGGNRYESATRDKHTLIENINLSILGASTIPTYESMFTTAMKDLGFINRLWVVPVKGGRRFALPKRIDERVKDQMVVDLRDTLERIRRNRAGMVISIPANSEKQFADWYMTTEQTTYANRVDSYSLRLMSLLAVNEGRDTVDDSILSKVLDLCNWQIKGRQQFEPVNANNPYAKMEEKIRRYLEKHPEGATIGVLRKGVNASIKGDGLYIFDRSLESLKKAGEVIMRENRYFLVPS